MPSAYVRGIPELSRVRCGPCTARWRLSVTGGLLLVRGTRGVAAQRRGRRRSSGHAISTAARHAVFHRKAGSPLGNGRRAEHRAASTRSTYQL
jgi:hypothetical protein